MGGLPPTHTSCKTGITELEAMLLSLYEILDLAFRAGKFVYDILSTLHRRRKKKLRKK